MIKNTRAEAGFDSPQRWSFKNRLTGWVTDASLRTFRGQLWPEFAALQDQKSRVEV
jgi:hypothetical protein